MNDWFDVLKAAYTLEGDTDSWLQGIAAASIDLVPGPGVMVYAYDASEAERGVDIQGYAHIGIPTEYVERNLELNARTEPHEVREIYQRGVYCATVSEVHETNPAMKESTYQDIVGAPADVFGLSASDPAHRGVAISAPLDAPMRLRNEIRQAWMRIGVHLNAAWRLRRRTESSESAPADELLERAVEMRTRADEKNSNGKSERGLEIWQGLVDGRWSVVERFDGNGARNYILVENDYGLIEPAGLSVRERQVLAHVVQGEGNKWIGYQLGIATGTVATLLSRAQAKLGIESRRELIWFYQSLIQGESS